MYNSKTTQHVNRYDIMVYNNRTYYIIRVYVYFYFFLFCSYNPAPACSASVSFVVAYYHQNITRASVRTYPGQSLVFILHFFFT